MKKLFLASWILASFSAVSANVNQFSVGDRVLTKSGFYTGSITQIYNNQTASIWVDGADEYTTRNLKGLIKSVKCDEKSGVCVGDKVNFRGELVKVKEIFENGLAKIYVKSAKESMPKISCLLKKWF